VRDEAVGFAGEKIVAWGEPEQTFAQTVAAVAGGAEIVTVIEGEGAPIGRERLPLDLPGGVEVEVHSGGQPSYWWLIAAQ
jgi:hypothetical protein